MKEVAKLAVPQIADWCTVDIQQSPNEIPENVAVEHFDPEKIKLAEIYNAKYPPDWTIDQGAPRVIRTGQAELYSEIPDELLKQACKTEEQYFDVLELGLKSAMVVPLTSRGRTFGVMSLFLANMSHEIRTPLGAILGFTDFLNDLELSHEERTKYTEIIHRNGQLLTQLIDDILNLSKVEAGHLEIESIETPLRRILSDISAIIDLQALEKGLKLEINYEPHVPDVIYSDPTRLRQILINLIGIAIKFTEKGFVRVTVKNNNPSTLEPSHILFIIEDSGPGIQVEDRAKLFEWFTQADSSTTRKFGGTGLGLALSRRLARRLVGDVQIDEPVVSGARFVASVATHLLSKKAVSFRMPAQEAIKTEVTNRQTENALDALKGLRILLVDDSADNRILIENILGRKGVKVQTGSNGHEGVEKALKNDHDIILMDIQMPFMDGLEATKALRQQGYKKPIIALTAHAMNIAREKTKAAGCDAHLTKPIDIQQLTNTLVQFATSRL